MGLTALVLLGGLPALLAEIAQPEDGRLGKATLDPPLDEWQFETVERLDGTVHQGLILAEGETEIELFEILRPPGKPMFAVIRPMRKEEIAAVKGLETPQRQRLIERVDGFRHRAGIEAGRMEDVLLRRETIAQSVRWVYDGAWFRLESTTDEQLTRRCIVRIEQIFRAYRQILPPRVQPSGRLLIELFGTMDQYRRRVHQSGLQIVHPAFFCSVGNRIVAGSDLNAYAQRLGNSQAHHAEVRREYLARHQAFPSALSSVLDELRRRGYSEAEIELESRLRRSVWQREYDTAMARIETVERRNQARFAEVTQQMFAMLYHEAFHAYVANYVLPASPSQLPRWLNEGLAQIFETAQLDGDTLRIDAPDAHRLRALQSDLRGPQPMQIARVLEAPDDHFLDGLQGDTAERLYLYAWGIAYYLTYEQDLLVAKRLDGYLANPEKFGPVARFTHLTGTPLSNFETAWQTAMLNRKPYTTPE